MNDITDLRVSTRNLSFSTALTTLQLVIDQTSLGEFKLCPRRYYYRIVEGWVPRHVSFHLTFGILMHQGREIYEHAKSKGADHTEALRHTVNDTLAATWDSRVGKPWNSEDPRRNKTRWTLLQSLTWYLDSHGKDDPAETVILANGKPAVELSFKFTPKDFYSGQEFTTITGEPMYFAGHLDRLAELGGKTYICDMKTTGRKLDQNYWAQFSPDNQVSFYTYAGQWGLHEPESPDKREISGVIIDAMQVKETGTTFDRQLIPRSPPQIVEWLEDTRHWLKLMGIYAEQNRWPMNDKACHVGFNGCPYRAVCSRTPGARQTWLEADYTKSPWDPSKARSE